MRSAKDTIEGWYATRDIQNYIAEDVAFEVMEGFPGGGLHRGQAAVHALFATYPTVYSEFEFVPEQVIDGGDTVVGVGRYRGRLRANEAPFDVAVAHVWDVKDGRIVRLRHFVNTWLMKEAAAATA